MAALGRLADLEQPVCWNVLGLPLQLERPDGLDVDGLADECKRRLPEQYIAGLRRLFEARGHIHRVARRQALLGSRDDHPGVDPDPRLDA